MFGPLFWFSYLPLFCQHNCYKLWFMRLNCLHWKTDRGKKKQKFVDVHSWYFHPNYEHCNYVLWLNCSLQCLSCWVPNIHMAALTAGHLYGRWGVLLFAWQSTCKSYKSVSNSCFVLLVSLIFCFRGQQQNTRWVGMGGERIFKKMSDLGHW